MKTCLFQGKFHFALGAIFLTLSLYAAFQRQDNLAPAAMAFVPQRENPAVIEEPFYQASFVSQGDTRLVHSATAVQRRDGAIQAFWFGGTREGHGDVQIFTSVYDPELRRWSDETALINRQATQESEHRNIKKLGNPVAGVDAQGRIWLFFVSVSYGGWSGSSINLTISSDNGQSWTAQRQLITSPFLNISTLVKGSPVFYQDGTVGLPVYHEFLGKFSEMLYLDSRGQVVDKVRITHGRTAIQPIIIPRDAQSAVALMRNIESEYPRRAWLSRTTDAGRTWSTPVQSEILNKDSALGGVSVGPGMFLSVANVSERNRSSLSLLRYRGQERKWSFVHDVEQPRKSLPPDQFAQEVTRVLTGQVPGTAEHSEKSIAAAATRTQCEPGRPHCDFRFDYPWLIMDDAGRFHLFYTWNRAYIRHVTFNAAWLESQADQSMNLLVQREARQ